MKSRIVLITGPDLNHQYFINRLNREFPIAGVLIEEVTYPDFPAQSLQHQEAWEWFFRRRREYEERIFAESEQWPRQNQPPFISIAAGQINSSDTLDTLQALQPDLVILFGSSLIGREMMDQFPGRILNLHLGISGQYRGSSCHFWPIHDERLDCLGATVMKINPGIDTGEILAQRTIAIQEGDTEQSLMGKCLILGMDLTLQVVHKGLKGDWTPLPLERNGKLFQKKHFTPAAVAHVKTMVTSGHLTSVIREQLRDGE